MQIQYLDTRRCYAVLCSMWRWTYRERERGKSMIRATWQLLESLHAAAARRRDAYAAELTRNFRSIMRFSQVLDPLLSFCCSSKYRTKSFQRSLSSMLLHPYAHPTDVIPFSSDTKSKMRTTGNRSSGEMHRKEESIYEVPQCINHSHGPGLLRLTRAPRYFSSLTTSKGRTVPTLSVAHILRAEEVIDSQLFLFYLAQ